MSHSFECHHCGRVRHDRFSHCDCGFDFRHFRHHDSHRRHDCRSLCDCHGRFHHRDRHCFDSHFRHRDHHCLTRHRICDDRFNVRLRGLDGGLFFRLRQLEGCVVKFEVECGSDCREFRGRICHVGRDFIEIEKFDHDKRHRDDCKCKGRKRKHDCKCKKHKHSFLIVPLNEIKLFKLDDDKKGCC